MKALKHGRFVQRGILELLESRTLLSAYFVSTSGSDSSSGGSSAPFATLQKAADTVKAGDTVTVRAGNYAGFEKYGLKGTSSAHIVFQADPGVYITSRSNESAVSCGIELSGYDASSGSQYVDLKGFNINNASGNITGAVSSGIRIRFSSNIGVYDCTANNNGWVGIYCAYVNNVTIDGCTSSNNNLFADSGTARNHGIYIANGSSNVTIRNCTVSSNNGNGIHSNGDGGMNSNLMIENNTISNNGNIGGSAINCDGLENSTIRNNLLYDNQRKGIALYTIDASAGSTGNVIVNNTVVQPSSNGAAAFTLKDGATNNTVRNNIFLGLTAMDIYSDSTSGLANTNNLTTSSALFVNPAANDYHLASTATAAIDKGTSSNAPSSDHDGNARPVGAGYDIGAFEYGGSSGTTTTTAPNAPTNLKAIAGTQSVSLTWTDNADDETGYVVQQSISGSGYSTVANLGAGTTSFTATGLAAGTAYTYRVYAVNSAGNSGYSNSASATPTASTPTTTAPSSPENLVATATNSQVDLTWTDTSINEANFRIDRSVNGRSYRQIATLAANSVNYTDANVTAGTTYSYRIRAYNTAGNSAWSNLASALVSGSTSSGGGSGGSTTTAPASTGTLYATPTSGKISLAWADKSNNETGFRIDRSSDGVNFTQLVLTGANATSYVDTSVTAGVTYTYRIRAFNSAGNSVWSNLAAATAV